MKYTYDSQEKALKYLIEKMPHDIEKFQDLYKVEVEEGYRAKVSLRDILFSDVWTCEEKEQLIKLYGYCDEEKHICWEHTYIAYQRDIGYDFGVDFLPLIDECVREKNYSGVQALLNLGARISIVTIIRIIEYIDDPIERYKFCELIVNHYKDKEFVQAWTGNPWCSLTEIQSLCDCYPMYIKDVNMEIRLSRSFSPMGYICGTNDLELIKLFLPTVKNINPLFKYAVNSGNIEIVKLFIEAGADVNYQDLEFANYEELIKTPLKIAIDNKDLKMIKLLHQNGANLNFVDRSERMQELINDLRKKNEKEEKNQCEDNWIKEAYFIWTTPPLEYAINLKGISTIDCELRNLSSKNKCKSYSRKVEIVKYLYENGATFGDGQINFTDLICFAIKYDDFETIKYFFDEALKNNSHLDFVKIINSIEYPVNIKTSYYSSIQNKTFDEGASPLFKLCEEYSKKIDKENHNRNVKLMLEKIFKNFAFNNYQFDRCREVIIKFSNSLPRDVIRKIPAVFGTSFENLDEVLSLGYDINCINSDGSSILMHYICNKFINVENIEKLISLGANPNYQGPDGINALSCAITQLPIYNFFTFTRNYNKEKRELYYAPEEYEKDKKVVVYKMIELSSPSIITSNSVKESVFLKIGPGYPQIIYNDVLQALVKKGLKVDDIYVTKSITFLDEPYSLEYITNPWEYLWNLYSYFSNKSIGTNHRFPKIEEAKNIKYGTEESNRLFSLICEHINRNFITTIEQIKNPNEIVENYCFQYTKEFEDNTYLRIAQDNLLSEISRYIGNIDYRQIITLIDNCSIIDTDSIIRKGLLPTAMDLGDMNLCKELVKRGVTIVCYDENGHDITARRYSSKQIEIFLSLNKKYNPNSEFENLLGEIGCNKKIMAKKKDVRSI